jgi:hypothetical protein
MTTFGDDIYCKTINGKAPTDHGTINLATVLQNGTDAGGLDIDGVNSYKGAGLEVTGMVKGEAGCLFTSGTDRIFEADNHAIGFFGATIVGRQAGGTDVTKASGGSGTTIPLIGDTTTNQADNLNDALFALYTQQKQIKDALKAYGLLS